MTKPGTIQRTGAQITVHDAKGEGHFAVQLVVSAAGKYEDRSDALLLIVDAWVQLMLEAGLDPDKSFQTMRNHGRLN